MAASRNLQKRTEILSGAYRLISEADYDRVSLNDIAKSAGINKSLLQSYYPQKQQIVGELLDDMLRQSYLYIDTNELEQGSLFNKVSDYTVLFFLTAGTDRRLNRFVITTTTHTELMDIWVDNVFQWFWSAILEEDGQPQIPYLRLKAALSFAMYGTLKLLRDRDKLNLTIQGICENHVRQLMTVMKRTPSEIEDVLSRTRERAKTFDMEAFLNYCENKIAWFSR